MEIKCIKSEEVKLDYALMKNYDYLNYLAGLLKIHISKFRRCMYQLSTNWK